MTQYLIDLLIALDQLANAVLWGAPDETLSSRAWRAEQKGRLLGRCFRPLIDTLFFFDKDHCHMAFLAEVQSRQLPPDFREIKA